MAITIDRLTYDDLVALQDLPEYEHVRLEIIGGELSVAPAPVPVHERVTINLIYALEHLVRSQRSGLTFSAPIAVRFSPQTWSSRISSMSVKSGLASLVRG